MTNTVSHPLSYIFSAEKFEFNEDDVRPVVVFTNCYLRDRFYYPTIQWDIMKNVLRCYTENKKKDVRCIKVSVLNCAKEEQIVDPSEAPFFFQCCSDFFRTMMSNHPDEIMHVSLRKLNDVPHKAICFLGETHKTYIDKNYVRDMMKFFDSFKSKEGMIIDLFTELGYHTESSNIDDLYNSGNTLAYVYTQLFKKLSDSAHVRIHNVDLRVLQCLQPLTEFQYYIEDHLEEIFDRKLNLEVLLIHVEIVIPLFRVDKIKTSFPVLFKQYKRINRIDLLFRMFRSFFTDTLKELMLLRTLIIEYSKNPNNSDIEKKIYGTNILAVENQNSVILHVNAGFMDLYTIGRLLKPGYNYCVFFGGAYHTFDVMMTLERFGFKMSKVSGTIDHTAPYVLDMFTSKMNAVIYK